MNVLGRVGAGVRAVGRGVRRAVGRGRSRSSNS
jgi:hypothetical protein